MKSLFRWGAFSLVAGILILQLVPYGHDHTNPPVKVEPKWDTALTRELSVRACFDCHSNQTIWPWYSNAAPASWLIQHDVEEGRQRLNFSEWDRPQRESRGAARQVQRGEMPPRSYIVLHPTASLSADEKQGLIQGLQNTLGSTGTAEGH